MLLVLLAMVSNLLRKKNIGKGRCLQVVATSNGLHFNSDGLQPTKRRALQSSAEVIENSRHKNYFSEKLLDALVLPCMLWLLHTCRTMSQVSFVSDFSLRWPACPVHSSVLGVWGTEFIAMLEPVCALIALVHFACVEKLIQHD